MAFFVLLNKLYFCERNACLVRVTLFIDVVVKIYVMGKLEMCSGEMLLNLR